MPQIINITYSDFPPTITEKNPGSYGTIDTNLGVQDNSYTITFKPNSAFSNLTNGYFILVNYFKQENEQTYSAKRTLIHIVNADIFTYPQNKSIPITI